MVTRRSDQAELQAEVLALRRQVQVLERQIKRVRWNLVSWARGSYAKAADAFEDLVRRLDPDERLGALVVDRQEETDGLLELRNAAVRPTADLLFREQRKPALDLVDPGAVGRRVVDVKARVAQQPGLDQRGLVGAVVIEHKVDIELVRHLLVDPVQESLELDRA